MVRRHERFRAIGSDTVFREAQQHGQCVHSAVQFESSVQHERPPTERAPEP